ncbi:MAG: hypothetical protein FWF59_12140 [Turicibacter sp.]|nr:hypothetical protein [Turicibacter sp.]
MFVKNLASFKYYQGQDLVEVIMSGNGFNYWVCTYRGGSDKPESDKLYQSYAKANDAFEHFFMNRHPRD